MIRIPLHVPIEFIRKMEISFEVNFYQSSFFDTFSKKNKYLARVYASLTFLIDQ